MNRATAQQFMDVAGSSGRSFPNWDEACAYYTRHYFQACMHILIPNFPPRTPPPAPSNSSNNGPKKKKSKIVQSSASSNRRRRRRSSSISSGDMFDDDEPVTPVPAKPVSPPQPSALAVADAIRAAATTAPLVRSPGNPGNPIEVPSNFPTPITKKGKSKARNQGGPTTPTLASASTCVVSKKGSNFRNNAFASISNGPERFIVVCDCDDEDSGYPSAPTSHSKEAIEILTDSDLETDIRPALQQRLCKCTALKAFLSTPKPALNPDINPDSASLDMDMLPEIPRPSPGA